MTIADLISMSLMGYFLKRVVESPGGPEIH